MSAAPIGAEIVHKTLGFGFFSNSVTKKSRLIARNVYIGTCFNNNMNRTTVYAGLKGSKWEKVPGVGGLMSPHIVLCMCLMRGSSAIKFHGCPDIVWKTIFEGRKKLKYYNVFIFVLEIQFELYLKQIIIWYWPVFLNVVPILLKNNTHAQSVLKVVIS